MSKEQYLMSNELLRREVSRTLEEYNANWEGKPETIFDLGVVRIAAQPHSSGALTCKTFPTQNLPQTLLETVAEVNRLVGRMLWVITPNSQPADLKEQMQAVGFTQSFEWDGLVLDNLDTPIPANPAVRLEPLSEKYVYTYSRRCTGSNAPAYLDYLHQTALDYLQLEPKELQFYVALMGDELVGYCTMRLEPSGVAYLRNAFTIAEYRKQGIYATMIAHRLQIAKAAGATGAVVQALTNTSSPVLQKYGFQPVSKFYGLLLPQ
jgi:N-acetylglutamate synthase-like GNAT family acetyltransferase